VVPVWSRRRGYAANPHDYTKLVLVRVVLHLRPVYWRLSGWLGIATDASFGGKR